MTWRGLTDAQGRALALDDADALADALADATGEQHRIATLQCAAEGKPRCLARLLERPDALSFATSEGDGQTLLHLAARFGRIEIMGILLDRGVDLNAQTVSGMTPLMMAAGGSRVEAVRLLLVHGADRSLTNRHGRTAYGIAQGPNRDQVKRILEGIAEA